MDQWWPEKVIVGGFFWVPPSYKPEMNGPFFRSTSPPRGVLKRNPKQEAFLGTDGRVHTTVSRTEGRVSAIAQNFLYRNAILPL